VTDTYVRCACGAVQVQLAGEPMVQYFCHCDDCQTVHGKANPVALYPVSAATVTHGETDALTLKTTPRTRCSRCGTFLFAEVPGHPVRGLNAELLPLGRFKPQFHVHCRYAATPIEDDLPHYKDTPTSFRGSGELMSW